MSEFLSIGSVTSGFRPIQSGLKYDSLFPKPNTQDRIIIQDGALEDTLELMKKVVWKYLSDTKKVSQKLKTESTFQTAQNIWEFLYHHIQYKLDQKGLEQLRRPARSWAERQMGIDCDCFSIFASSILTNLQIPHSFRVARYDADYFQHVYVVLDDKGKEIIIDPVLSRFDYEKAYTQKKDYTMSLQGIDVAVLSGTHDELGQFLLGDVDVSGFVESSGEESFEDLYKYMVNLRSSLDKNPSLIQDVEDPAAFIQMLDYAIQYWYTDKRDEALEVLAHNEFLFNQKQGLRGDADGDSLGGVKEFFTKVGDFVKNAASGVADTAKKFAKGVIRVNPLVAASRIGFLAALKLNLKKMSSKIKWAYASESEALAKGISKENWQKAKTALAKIEKLYVDKLQGKSTALKEAILKGRAGGLNGVVSPELGEPVTIVASIAAATPVIVAVIKIIKDAGLFENNDDTSTNNLIQEAQALQKANPQMNLLEDELLPMYYEQSKEPANPSQIIPKRQAAQVSSQSSGGLMTFVKNNPIPSVAILALLSVGGYYLYRSSKRIKKPATLGGVKQNDQASAGSNSKRKRKNKNSQVSTYHMPSGKNLQVINIK